MTATELNEKFEKTANDMKSDVMGKVMVQIASQALVTIRRRVKETGTNAEGQKYIPYSTRPMLSGCKGFLNKTNCPATSKAKRKELKWVMVARGTPTMRPLFEIPGGYKEFRELNNLQTSFVDFAFSNRMWTNIKIVSSYSEHSAGVARIAAITPEDKSKLEGNTNRRGDILKLSDAEIKEIVNDFKMNIVQSIHNNGL
jgi:hypothetical protein